MTMKNATTLITLLMLAACTVEAEDDMSFETAEGHEQELEAEETEPECEQPTIELLAQDAELLEPMILGTTYAVDPDGGKLDRYFAASDTPDEGLAVFHVRTECAGTWGVSALVRDPVAGRNAEKDPDSIRMQIDDEPELLWEYGCQTSGEGAVWEWLPFSTWTGECSGPTVDFKRREAGDHIITFRSAEAYQGVRWSALGGVRVEVRP